MLLRRLTAAWRVRQPSAFGSIAATPCFNRTHTKKNTHNTAATKEPHYSCKNTAQRISRTYRRVTARKQLVERSIEQNLESVKSARRAEMSSQSKVKSSPSVFYIGAVTWNPHPALNFPVKYTTFHVTHTNPAAISLSLNRGESLYLNSLTAVAGIVVTSWRGQKEKPQSCVSV